MGQQVRFGKPTALHQRQSAGSAERSRRVGLSSPNRFQLNMPHPAQEDVGLLQFEISEGTADGILGPTLRIGLFRVFKESVECLDQVWDKFMSIELPDQARRLRRDEVVLIRE